MSGRGQLEKNNVDESLDEVDRQTDRRFSEQRMLLFEDKRSRTFGNRIEGHGRQYGEPAHAPFTSDPDTPHARHRQRLNH